MGFYFRRPYLRTAPRFRKAWTDMIAAESKVTHAAMASVIGMGAFVIWSSLAGLAGCFA